MNEDASTSALQEIAALLRRRVQQVDESEERAKEYRKRSDEEMAKITSFSSHIPDAAKIEEDGKKRMEEMKAMSEQRMAAQKVEKERTDAETRQFQENLLAELARHNSLLERIITQLEK